MRKSYSTINLHFVAIFLRNNSRKNWWEGTEENEPVFVLKNKLLVSIFFFQVNDFYWIIYFQGLDSLRNDQISMKSLKLSMSWQRKDFRSKQNNFRKKTKTKDSKRRERPCLGQSTTDQLLLQKMKTNFFLKQFSKSQTTNSNKDKIKWRTNKLTTRIVPWIMTICVSDV